MNSDNRYKEIIESAIDPTKPGKAYTMVVSGHLAQMTLFMLRQGVEFFPQQDSFNEQRRKFIARVMRYNKLDQRLEAICREFLVKGKGLFYFEPNELLYKIYWFHKDQYRTYYDYQGNLERVVIIYSYYYRPERGQSSWQSLPQEQGSHQGKQRRWIRLELTSEEIKTVSSSQKLSLDSLVTPAHQSRTETKDNLSGFITAVEVYNKANTQGNEGYGEFDSLAAQIVEHDALVADISANISFFGRPTLVTSRPREDIIESDTEAVTPTMASESGFEGEGRISTRKSDPMTRGYPGENFRGKVPRVISRLQPNDRVGYIVPDAVSADQASYQREQREGIRTALGGVDELGISSGATAFEIRSLFGRAAATAKRKADNLFTYGLCEVFSLMIRQEEAMFKASFAQLQGIKPPPPPVKVNNEADFKYQTARAKFEAELDQAIAQAIAEKTIPGNTQGLVPDGDSMILWRWTGPVYEESTREILENSIVVRNLQELGVDSVEALRYQFPDKTPEERERMLGGYPFRMSQQLLQAFAQLIQTSNQALQTPHPLYPEISLALDPTLNVYPILQKIYDQLRKEISMGPKWQPEEPEDRQRVTPPPPMEQFSWRPNGLPAPESTTRIGDISPYPPQLQQQSLLERWRNSQGVI
jgi:hypothetical protein